MKPHEHTASAIGLNDEATLAPESESERLRTRAALHAVLARRPELETILPRLAHYRGALAFLRAIR